MAFDPQDDFLHVETDLTAVHANYLDAALFAGAFVCIDRGISEWYVHEVMPGEDAYRAVEEFYNNEEPTDPEAAATYLLLVREALRG